MSCNVGSEVLSYHQARQEQTVMNCQDKARLHAEYYQATQALAEALSDLYDTIGTSAQEEYERLR